MKKILMLVSALSLGGCGLSPIDNPYGIVAPVSPAPASPAPPRLGSYTTKVYWAKDIQQLAADLRAHPNKDVIIYGVSPQGYQTMQNNWQELSRYIEGQRHVIAYYRKD